MSGFDIRQYWTLFGAALEERYDRKDRFRDGFARIKSHYDQLRPGPHRREISVDDVLLLFDGDLPYRDDWSRPDRDDLARRMDKAPRVADLIRRLPSDRYSEKLISGIRYCFRDLGLTALVLHHVCPERYAICSHHLASLLFVTGRTVPEFYVNYCRELFDWSQDKALAQLNVAETEFALWTWYWFAHGQGGQGNQASHQQAFEKDPWIRQRIAANVARALEDVGKIDLARSFVKTQPTAAAIIAWREFERMLRRLLPPHARRMKMGQVIEFLDNSKPVLPGGWTGGRIRELWCRTPFQRGTPSRDVVMHGEGEVEPEDAEEIVRQVSSFAEHGGLS